MPQRVLTGLTLAFIFLLILAWDIDAAHWITSGGAYPGVFGIRGALAKVSPVIAVLPCTSVTLLLGALVGAVLVRSSAQAWRPLYPAEQVLAGVDRLDGYWE